MWEEVREDVCPGRGKRRSGGNRSRSALVLPSPLTSTSTSNTSSSYLDEEECRRGGRHLRNLTAPSPSLLRHRLGARVYVRPCVGKCVLSDPYSCRR